MKFFSEDTDFVLHYSRKVGQWLESVIREEGFVPKKLSVIFCSDTYLLDINNQYLNHDYYTDIITFNYNHDQNISGDLFVSIDRVVENALKYEVTMLHELYRVLVHGVLHLCGYEDSTLDEQTLMRTKENYYLSNFIGEG